MSWYFRKVKPLISLAPDKKNQLRRRNPHNIKTWLPIKPLLRFNKVKGKWGITIDNYHILCFYTGYTQVIHCFIHIFSKNGWLLRVLGYTKSNRSSHTSQRCVQWEHFLFCGRKNGVKETYNLRGTGRTAKKEEHTHYRQGLVHGFSVKDKLLSSIRLLSSFHTKRRRKVLYCNWIWAHPKYIHVRCRVKKPDFFRDRKDWNTCPDTTCLFPCARLWRWGIYGFLLI